MHYYLPFLMSLLTSLVSVTNVYSITLGYRKENRKVVKKDSIYRKLFLRKNKSFELRYVAVIPAVISLVLLLITLVMTLMYLVFEFALIGELLSFPMGALMLLWYIILAIYYAIIGT